MKQDKDELDTFVDPTQEVLNYLVKVGATLQQPDNPTFDEMVRSYMRGEEVTNDAEILTQVKRRARELAKNVRYQ